jgi:hypothetical protein
MRPAWLTDFNAFKALVVGVLCRLDLTEEMLEDAFTGLTVPQANFNYDGWNDWNTESVWISWLKNRLPAFQPVAPAREPIPYATDGCKVRRSEVAEIQSHLCRTIGQRTKLGMGH